MMKRVQVDSSSQQVNALAKAIWFCHVEGHGVTVSTWDFGSYDIGSIPIALVNAT